MAVKKLATPQALKKGGDPLEVSQSTIKGWRRCHAQYDYRYVQLLSRKRPIIQLIRGTMLGKCFDGLALNRGSKKPIPVGKVIEVVLKPYVTQYGKLFNEEKEYYGDIISEVTRIATKYALIYENDGLIYLSPPPKMGDGKEVLSAPFELPIHVDLAPGIVFTGHIDKMPVDKYGRVWDMDHKSHKSIPDPEDRFSDLQQVFYQWAMPLSGYDKPTGVIWDYVRTKPPAIPEELKAGGLTKRKNIDTDYDTYMAEVVRLKLNPKDYQEILKPLKERGHMDFFLRVQLPSPPKLLIENVVADAKTTALEIQKLGGVSKVRTITRDCKGCEYYSLCQAEFRGLDASFIRKTEYETNPDPRHIHIKRED